MKDDNSIYSMAKIVALLENWLDTYGLDEDFNLYNKACDMWVDGKEIVRRMKLNRYENETKEGFTDGAF